MSIPRSAAQILSQHVTLELEGIDRMYLNVYVPRLQREAGVASFSRFHRGRRFASSVLMDPISQAFVAEIEGFAAEHELDVVAFRKGERKDDVAAAYRKAFPGDEGVLFIGKAPEKTAVFRTKRRRNAKPGPLPLAGALHGHGQSLLRLRAGPRLRSLLPEVLHLFPRQREAVHQRARMAQAATEPPGHRLPSPR